jgi:hypothetical protein
MALDFSAPALPAFSDDWKREMMLSSCGSSRNDVEEELSCRRAHAHGTDGRARASNRRAASMGADDVQLATLSAFSLLSF